MCDFAFVLLAGGSGSRLGSPIPKQFIRVAGKTIVEHSFDSLQRFTPDARIVVTVPAHALEHARELFKGSKAEVIVGGSNRQASALAALQHLQDQPPKNVILHDSARPFLSHQILHDVVEALKHHEAVDVAIKTSDTIIVERDGFIQSIPKRNHLYRGQTPQGFRYRALMRSYQELGPNKLADFTDDCGIFLACHPMEQVRIVQGSAENIKITDAIDLVLADELFRIRQQHLTPNLNGLSLQGKHVIVFGGSMGIGKAISQVLEEAGALVHSVSRRNGCDIADAAQVAACVNEQLQVWGRIDLVVNAAGLLVKGPLVGQSPAIVAQQVAVNLLGALNVAQCSYAALKASGGMLLQFSSSSFTRGRAEYSTYSACKAAIVNLTQALADEWKADGIRVNCIVPGRTNTAMRRSNFMGEDERTLLSPYEVALTSAKLLSSLETGVIARV
jgi:ribitol-5-phosphate 2-dehydrogenase (NADP+) / D-ribitol-5-phosphate cytidylyltransferase